MEKDQDAFWESFSSPLKFQRFPRVNFNGSRLKALGSQGWLKAEVKARNQRLEGLETLENYPTTCVTRKRLAHPLAASGCARGGNSRP
jgi:hypothetical protein